MLQIHYSVPMSQKLMWEGLEISHKATFELCLSEKILSHPFIICHHSITKRHQTDNESLGNIKIEVLRRCTNHFVDFSVS